MATKTKAPPKKKAVAPAAPKARVQVLALPIARMRDEQGELVPAAQMWEILGALWQRSFRLANWGVQELLRRDVQPRDADGFWKMPSVQLYNLAFVRQHYPDCAAWQGMTQSASSVLRAVERKWGRVRRAVLWAGEERPPLYKYGMPFPFHRASARYSYSDDGRPLVRLSLPTGRFQVELRGGPEFGRQLGLFRRIVSGELRTGEVNISRQRTSASCGRLSVAEKEPGGQQTAHYRPMLRIAVTIPAAQEKQGETMLLLTDPNALLVALVPGHAPWIYNADHARRKIAEHAAYLQRISEDTKFEKRYPPHQRRIINAARAKRCDKLDRWYTTFVQETAALVAKYALRQKVGTALYGDTCRDYLPSFRWHALETRLKQRLEREGIRLVTATKEDIERIKGEE